MPYEVKKVGSRFKVFDDKGRAYSKKGLTKAQARRQQQALYASAYHGSGYCMYHDDGGPHFLIEGGGLFTEVFSKARRIASAVANRIQDVSQGIRQDYPPDVRATIAKYGSGVVEELLIRREPIQSFINTALNFISLGQWNKARNELNYDKLFHLSMIATLKMPDGSPARIIIEKNEVINISPNFSMRGKMEMINVPVPCCITLQQMLDKAVQAQGPRFFEYDAFNNNCQMFLMSILDANGLTNPSVKAFILQDVDGLLKRVPTYVSPFAKALTNVAGLFNVALKGRGEKIYCGRKNKRNRRKGEPFECFNRGRAVGFYLGKQDKAKQEDMFAEPEPEPVKEEVKKEVKQEEKPKSIYQSERALKPSDLFRMTGAEIKALARRLEIGSNLASNAKQMKEAVFILLPVLNAMNEKGLQFRHQLKGFNDDALMKKIIDKGFDGSLGSTNLSEYLTGSGCCGSCSEVGGCASCVKCSGGAMVNMKSSDYFAEHKKLIALLDGIAKKAKAEATEQSGEVKAQKKKLKQGGCSTCGGEVSKAFKEQLEEVGLTPEKYLAEVRKRAKATGYDPSEVQLADDGEHKIVVRGSKAGRVGYGDHIIWSHLEEEGKVPENYADKKRSTFHKSHSKIKGDWKKDKFSPNNLALSLLW